ncbi:MAG: S1C family serine protease [Acutalibacteraceae bacterium]
MTDNKDFYTNGEGNSFDDENNIYSSTSQNEDKTSKEDANENEYGDSSQNVNDSNNGFTFVSGGTDKTDTTKGSTNSIEWNSNEYHGKPSNSDNFTSYQPKSYNPYESFGQNGNSGYGGYTDSTGSPAVGESEKKRRKPKKPKKPMSAKKIVALCVVCSTILSVFFGAGGAFVVNKFMDNSSSGVTVNKVERATGSVTSTKGNALTTEEIASSVASSVVEITTESVSTGSFYQQYITKGAGSGVIISEEGYIMTNNHVINGASKITVNLRDGKSFKAKIVGSDEEQDIAIIKITPGDKKLTVATFGDSDKINVGEKAVVIGNPLGQLGGSVSEGIVSALDRSLTVENQNMNLMQIDASVNPGNSGGGVFNEYGELIGIVVAKVSSSGSDSETVEGLGFAIPINDALDILDDLIDYGYVRGKVRLGVTLLDISSESEAMMYGLSEKGVYVYSVEEDSPAELANIKSGDRIISVNGQKISFSEEVQKIIDSLSVGDKAKVTVERSGQTGTLTATLTEDKPETQETEDVFATESTDQNSNGNSFWNNFFS